FIRVLKGFSGIFKDRSSCRTQHEETGAAEFLVEAPYPALEPREISRDQSGQIFRARIFRQSACAGLDAPRDLQPHRSPYGIPVWSLCLFRRVEPSRRERDGRAAFFGP